jgi:hypothetical protein
MVRSPPRSPKRSSRDSQCGRYHLLTSSALFLNFVFCSVYHVNSVYNRPPTSPHTPPAPDSHAGQDHGSVPVGPRTTEPFALRQDISDFGNHQNLHPRLMYVYVALRQMQAGQLKEAAATLNLNPAPCTYGGRSGNPLLPVTGHRASSSGSEC